jgi:hypothetical protein
MKNTTDFLLPASFPPYFCGFESLFITFRSPVATDVSRCVKFTDGICFFYNQYLIT